MIRRSTYGRTERRLKDLWRHINCPDGEPPLNWPVKRQRQMDLKDKSAMKT